MTNGMAALMKSLDVYYKATIGHEYQIPEGSEVNGDISNCDHVPLPQYPVKADGYFRFYNATKYKPYKDLGNHIINKLYKTYKETKDFEDNNFLIWNNLISNDDIVYGYGAGLKMKWGWSDHVPFNQSKNKFFLKDVTYVDALGQGLIDLSEIKNTLDVEVKDKLIEILNGTFYFLNQPEILIQSDDVFYWRIDAFDPKAPKPCTSKLEIKDWSVIGADIILMFIAFYQFDQKSASLYTGNIAKFSSFYVKNRMKLSEQLGPHFPHNIYKLDHRMLTLASFANENGITELDFLFKWLTINLPIIYKEIPKVEYSVNGATKNSWSTQGVLEIYRLLGMKTSYNQFWNSSFEKNFKQLGLFNGNRIQPMNFSSYPIYFDYAQKANLSGILSDDVFIKAVKKLFWLYGNSKLHRDNLLYAIDSTDEIRKRPMFACTPYAGYVEGILPEGIYANGSSQAFYLYFGNGKINQFFTQKNQAIRYEWDVVYSQYTAPFQFHSDRFSYGKAESMCLLLMTNSMLKSADLVKNEDYYFIETTCKAPLTVLGLPAFGVLDTTEILYINESARTPSELKVEAVEKNGKKMPFRSYQIFDYNRIMSGKDKSKLVFGVWNLTPGKEIKVKIIFKKKSFQNYFSNVENPK